MNLDPRVDEALQQRLAPHWGPTQACSAMVERYLEAMDRAPEHLHPTTIDMVERALQGRYLAALDIAILPAIVNAAGDLELSRDLAKLNYYQLCAVVDAVERRRATKHHS